MDTLPLSTDKNQRSRRRIQTENVVLTVEAYSAREDVMLYQTDTLPVKTIQEDFGPTSESLIRSGYRAYGLYGNDLDIVNAPDAWARGWTGKGSTIAILDSGIDSDHSEFAGRIMAQECFTSACTNEGVDDLNGHGTHVAGIAAAAFDGAGTTGVAFDAELLVGKVANQGRSRQHERRGARTGLGKFYGMPPSLTCLWVTPSAPPTPMPFLKLKVVLLR